MFLEASAKPPETSAEGLTGQSSLSRRENTELRVPAWGLVPAQEAGQSLKEGGNSVEPSSCNARTDSGFFSNASLASLYGGSTRTSAS